MQGHAGLRRADQRRHGAVLDPGLAQGGACLPGQGFGPAPFTPGHGQQGSFAQRGREHLVRADVLRAAGRVLEVRVTAIEVAAQGARDSLQEQGRRREDAFLRAPPRGLVGVGAHLLDPVPAQAGPEHGRPRLGRRGHRAGPGRVLPAVDHVGPPLGLGRRPTVAPRSAASTASIGCPSIAPRSSSHRNHRWRVVIRPCRSAGSQSLSPVGRPHRRPRPRWSTPAPPRAGRGAGTSRRRGAAGPGSARARGAPVRPAACRGTSDGSGTTPPAGPGVPAAGSTGPDPPGSRRPRAAPAPPRTAARTSAPAPRSGSGTPAAARRSAPGIDSTYSLTSRSSPLKETPAPAGEPPPAKTSPLGTAAPATPRSARAAPPRPLHPAPPRPRATATTPPRG